MHPTGIIANLPVADLAEAGHRRRWTRRPRRR